MGTLRKMVRRAAPILVLACANFAAAAPILNLYNTGVATNNPVTGLPASVVADGAADPFWTVTSVPAASATPDMGEYSFTTPFNAITVIQTSGVTTGGYTNYPLGPATPTTNGPWQPDTSTSKWISVHANEGAAGIENVGNYTYQTTFSLTGLNPATASITGDYFDDDALVSLSLNGTVIAGIGSNTTNVSTAFGGPAAISIPVGSPFIAGTNTITIVIANDQLPAQVANNPTGLDLYWTGTATAIPEPVSMGFMGIGAVLALVHRGRRKAN